MAPPRGIPCAAAPAFCALLKFFDFYLRAAVCVLLFAYCCLRTAVCVLLFARRADYLNSTFRTA